MQAIRTKFAGPTNTRGSRIIATSYKARTVYPYDHELDSDTNHARAAELHVAIKWDTDNDPSRVYQLAHGVLPDGSHAHVLTGWF